MVLTLLSNIKTQRKISSNLFGLIKKYEQCIHYMYSNIAIFHFCQDKKNTLRRRSWPLLFLDRVWPPRSSALCFLVQKEVEREKKSQKTSFLGMIKFLTRSVFHKLLLCFHNFFSVHRSFLIHRFSFTSLIIVFPVKLLWDG